MTEISSDFSGADNLWSARRLLWAVLAVLFFALYAFVGRANAIDSMPPQAKVYEAINHDVSPPLRDILKVPPQAGFHQIPLLPIPHKQVTAAPDAALQETAGPVVSTSLLQSFDGLGQGFPGFTLQYIPPDTNGAVGNAQYVQWVNASFAVFNKTTGALEYGPVAGNTLWSGFGGPCERNNSGDPIAQFDKIAGRWVMMQPVFKHPYTVCVAVSTTSDATGSYYRYAFPVSNFPDYPKLGVWPDGYYVSFNQFSGNSFLGAEACALDRGNMLLGNPASMQCFSLSRAYGGLLPSDLDGLTLPPDGSPDFFLNFGNNSLNLWKFHVDFNNSANSTFTGPVNIPVASFTEACGGGTCIPQSGTSQLLDSLGDRLMYRLAYRNFGGHASLVANHSVQTVNGNTGVRWYEIRDPNGSPSVYQEGTYAPDSSYRWMGSIAMDNLGDIALGYSVSSPSMHPAIRYTGHIAGVDSPGYMEGEQTIIDGTGSQTNYNRWGDYSGMTIDPMDDCTFWYTTEYLKNTGYYWSTRIAHFILNSCSPSSYSVAGTVTVPGVTIDLSGAGSGTVTTDAGGNYSFSGLNDGGTYYITPTATGYTFSPSTITVTLNGQNEIGQNFVATPVTAATYSISGTVTDSAGGGALVGVTMTLDLNGTTSTTTTDGSGYYTFSGLADGSTYAVTPSYSGYTFLPASASGTISGSNVAEDFTGTANTATTYSISGTLTDSGSGTGIGGVNVILSGASSATVTTDSSGNYTFSSLANGSYTVTPSSTGYNFSPTSRDVTISGSNVTGVDFSGTAISTGATYSISGTVTDSSRNRGVGGVTMTLYDGTTTTTVVATTNTSGNGSYSFSGVSSGTYTLTATKNKYNFSSSSPQTVVITNLDATNVNFTGSR